MMKKIWESPPKSVCMKQHRTQDARQVVDSTLEAPPFHLQRRWSGRLPCVLVGTWWKGAEAATVSSLAVYSLSRTPQTLFTHHPHSIPNLFPHSRSTILSHKIPFYYHTAKAGMKRLVKFLMCLQKKISWFHLRWWTLVVATYTRFAIIFPACLPCLLGCLLALSHPLSFLIVMLLMCVQSFFFSFIVHILRMRMMTWHRAK